jgi:lipopolysaccharide export system protein LptA
VTGPKTHLHVSKAYLVLAAIVVVMIVCLARPGLRGQTATSGPTVRDAITISADMSHEWTDGSVRISLLRGRCRIVQGKTVLSARQMVVFHGTESNNWETRDRLTVYLEDDVRIDRPGGTVDKSVMLVHLVTRSGVTSRSRSQSADKNARTDDPLYRSALRRLSHNRRRTVRAGTLLQTQLIGPDDDPTDPEMRSVRIQTPPGNLRRVRISPRSAVRYNVHSFESNETTPPEQISVLTGGVNVLIDGAGGYGTVDLSADRMVIWTPLGNAGEFRSETVQTRDTKFQVYMEGNIVIRQGGDPLALPAGSSDGDLSFVEQQRKGALGEIVLRATRAVYDAKDERALLLNAELKTFVPRLQGDLRIRAQRIRQLAKNSFHAQNAWLTGSEFAKPGYRMQSTDIFYEPRIVNPWVGPRGGIDPVTGQPIVTEVPWITSLNNTFFVGSVPLFYAPFLAGPAEKPNIPLSSATVGHDQIFGAKFEAVWNMFTLLGLEEPRGVSWDLETHYYGERGPALGTRTQYHGNGLFGLPGVYFGFGRAYGVFDSGQDNLGGRRQSLEPETDARGRILLRHRQAMPYNYTLIGEIGLISDRNFLEQYFEHEFDQQKDNETLLYLKQHNDNLAWSVLARGQLNDFENTTEWLPRGDLFLLSEPLMNGLVTWSSHTSAGYANLEPAVAPSDPNDIFTPLPFVADVSGAVLMSRHELNMPLNLGPVNVVPFLFGEAAFWGEDAAANSSERFVGSAGVRSSVLVWRTYPAVYSRIFNLNGLAHKIRLEAEYAWTESTKDLGEIAQYNEFDDNAQERFRQRLITNTFGGMLPAIVEPRFYAIRTGAGRAVTAPYHELIDDQQVLRLALRQRLQTKVGPPERLRVKDWMRFDLEASFFPNPGRDNFGEDVGLLGGQYVWNFGDRTRLEASAYVDMFDNAPELWSIALLSERGARGSIFLGLRQVKGTGSLDSQIVTFSYNYAMGPKWISSVGTSYDIREQRNAGQSLLITRIGKDFLIHFGLSYNETTENFGFALSVEPRFGLTRGASALQFGPLLDGAGSPPR